MLVIGLTGGIGTGKSEVSRILREMGAVVIDADKVGHETYAANSETWRVVVATFGEDVVLPDGQIDRQALSSIVFDDSVAVEKLNAIMHPRMAKLLEERIQQHREVRADVVLEAALLVEAGWNSLVDEVWVVTAPEEEAIRRASSHYNISPEAIRSRIRSQMPAEEKLKYADVVVGNTGSLEELRARVQSLWHSRLKERVK